MSGLTSKTWEVETYSDGVELCYERGWTDGLPVVLPTPEKVDEFLRYVDLEPDHVVGNVPERNREITAEKVAINAVMAGCRKEYLPVVIAAVAGVTAPKFEFNHLASMGSPTPVLLVSGPIVESIGMNYGTWVLGPGSRVNATIGRALSLVLWNCAELRPEGILRGTYGNPLRWTSGCVAEHPRLTGYTSLREYLGYSTEESTVTVHSNSGAFTQVWTMKPGITDTLQAIASALIGGSGNFNRGVYVLLLAPPIINRFAHAGMSLEDVRQWLLANTGRTMASLMDRGFPPAGEAHRLWATDPTAATQTLQGRILAGAAGPQDAEQFVHLFASNGDLDELIWSESQLTRETDIYIVATGADVSYGCVVMSEYDVSTEPVTVKIQVP